MSITTSGLKESGITIRSLYNKILFQTDSSDLAVKYGRISIFVMDFRNLASHTEFFGEPQTMLGLLLLLLEHALDVYQILGDFGLHC